MARALISRTNVEIQGENLKLSWMHIFYGAPLAAPDAGTGEVIVTPTMTVQDAKTAIKNAIQADATRLGLGTLNRAPQHADEIFHNL